MCQFLAVKGISSRAHVTPPEGDSGDPDPRRRRPPPTLPPLPIAARAVAGVPACLRGRWRRDPSTLPTFPFFSFLVLSLAETMAVPLALAAGSGRDLARSAPVTTGPGKYRTAVCRRVLPRTAVQLPLLLPRLPGRASSHRQEDLHGMQCRFR
jgi:hypothetical protein